MNINDLGREHFIVTVENFIFIRQECLQSNKLNGFEKEQEEETTSLAASEELGEKQKRNICRTDSRGKTDS